MQWLAEGKKIALVSDAGLPAISDPGADLVRDAVAAGFAVIPVPGANAALSALIASGLPTDTFLFAGFLPREKKERLAELERLRRYPETLLFYEAPHRIKKTVADMQEAWGDRQAVLARELTKRYEEFARGTLTELVQLLSETEARGEYCIVIEGNSGQDQDGAEAAESTWWQALSLIDHVDHYAAQGMSNKEAIKKAAEDRGIAKRDVYHAYHRKKE